MGEIKRILYVHHTTSLGGATNSMLYNIQNLPKDSFEAEVLFLDNEGIASEIFRKNGIKIHHLAGINNYQHAENAIIKWVSRKPLKPVFQFFRMLRSVPVLEQYLTDNKYDIIHINTSVMLSFGIAAHKKNLKIVWHVREPIAKGVLGIRRILVRRIIKKNASKIIAISEQDSKSLGKSNKINVVYNFVDFKKFDKNIASNTLSNEFNTHPQTKFITMLGGIVHSKGADLFIKAIPSVLEKNPEVIFVIVGYPPNHQKPPASKNPIVWIAKAILGKKDLSKECLRLIADYGIEENVKFVGLRQDIPQILASSHILVWPGTVPHFSRPIIEAQAMGVPAIGTGFDSTKEIITDRETGLLFKKGDFVDLSNKINLLLQDGALYESIQEKSFQQAHRMFNSENNFKKILTIYNSL